MNGTVYRIGLYLPILLTTLKTRLDKHCHNQDIIYDFTAQLHGTGSRSESLN